MKVALIIVWIGLWIGIVHIVLVLILAKKVQYEEQYSAEKELEEWDFLTVEGINLNFIEQVTKELIANDFRWIDDYRVREKDSAYLKVLKHYNMDVECYVRYFVHEIQNTVGSITFYKVYKKDVDLNGMNQEIWMHYFSLETGFKNNKHLQSGIIYEPSIGAEALFDLLQVPESGQRFYKDEGEIKEMIKEHMQWITQEKQVFGGLDTLVMHKPLAEVLVKWWQRAYAMQKKIYRYDEKQNVYRLTLSYCIKVVCNCPLTKRFKQI